MGSRPYSCDLATEIEALLSTRHGVFDALAFVAIWLLMLFIAN